MTQQPRSAPRGRPARSAIYGRLDFEIKELQGHLGGLPRPEEADAIWTDIWYREAHNSTALEGNTLILREVETLLAQGRAIGDKELKDYLEVKGYATAAEWVYDQGIGSVWAAEELLTITEVRHVHHLAMTPVWEVAPHPLATPAESPGNWRQHDIRPFAGGMIPPQHPLVPSLVRDWVDDVCRVRDDTAHIAEAIATRHAAFERIHPFIDGNGRAGRLLLNLVLVRLGYPPAIVEKRRRRQYLDALDRADKGDPGPLGEILARAVLDNLTRFVLPAITGPARLLPLDALASRDLGTIALRAAAQRGRLRAIRGDDGRWQSSRKWLEEYVTSRYATLRRPRP
jgi:Fic family protein